MKPLRSGFGTFFCLFWLAALVWSCQSSPSEETSIVTPAGDTLVGPGAYNDYLVGKQEQIILGITRLGSTFQTFDSTQILGAYDGLQQEINKAIGDVESLEAFEGDSILKPATLRLFRFYEDVSDNEYQKITSIILQGPNGITQSDLQTIDSLTQAIAQAEIRVDSLFEAAQNRFAKQYNMVILENEFEAAPDTLSPE